MNRSNLLYYEWPVYILHLFFCWLCLSNCMSRLHIKEIKYDTLDTHIHIHHTHVNANIYMSRQYTSMIHTYMCIHLFHAPTCMCIHIHIYTHAYTHHIHSVHCVCIFTCITCMHACTHAHIHGYTHIYITCTSRTNICTWTCALCTHNIHINTCIRAHVCIGTGIVHIHTHACMHRSCM